MTTAAGTVAAPVTIVDCQGCGACLLTCPRRAIRPVAGPVAASTGPGLAGPAVLVVLADRCDGCAECVEVCPVGAVHLTAPALIGGAP